MAKLPQYTKEKMKGNIGEALVQYLLSDFCLVHKIDGSNDIGNDFICELIRDENPTNLLFYVQLKYTDRKPHIKRETLEYWKGSPIPVYLFWVKDKHRVLPVISAEHFSRSEKKYKRYTPFLHSERRHSNEDFKPFNKRTFLRDLIIDYARTQYKKGFTPVIKPRDFLTLEEKMNIGFRQYKLLVRDVIPEYKSEIIQGGWANLFSLAISLDQSANLEDRKLALSLLKTARTLIHRDENIIDYDDFVHSINSHIERLSSELQEN